MNKNGFMTQRSAFQLQILEKLGAPLVAAVGDVAAKRTGNNDDDSPKKDAERVAELLSKAVKVSVDLAGSMDLKDAGGQGDSIRLALAAVAGRLIAGQYRSGGKIPAENEIQRLVKAMEAVLTFSDSFAPAAENVARLENIEPGAMLEDESQINIQYVSVFAPVVSAIVSFSFGRPESKLAQEVSGRLVERAEKISGDFFQDASGQIRKQAELRILSALSQIYVACHEKEMAKLMAMDEQARAKAAEESGGVLPMDPVWNSFEVCAGMVAVLARDAVSVQQGNASVERAPEKTGPESAPAMQEQGPVKPSTPLSGVKQEEPKAVSEEKVLELSQEEDAEPPEEGGEQEEGYNPMGFFKPKEPPAEGGEGEV